jgi:hypothetical protein
MLKGGEAGAGEEAEAEPVFALVGLVLGVGGDERGVLVVAVDAGAHEGDSAPNSLHEISRRRTQQWIDTPLWP